nr:hypothetical protein GCM10020241_09120 [Streptoalloteichus tenebrarius]
MSRRGVEVDDDRPVEVADHVALAHAERAGEVHQRTRVDHVPQLGDEAADRIGLFRSAHVASPSAARLSFLR